MKPWAPLFWLWTLLLPFSEGARLKPSAFSFVGPSNRLITPNSDHLNDNVVFVFDNPAASEVTIRIYDLHGKLVVGNLPPGPNGIGGVTFESRVWDGKADGLVVAGGVYIYVIEVEDTVISGSVVVVK